MSRRGDTPEPTPTVPDVEIFGDEECTVSPIGRLTTVWAKINVPWVGIDSGWNTQLSNNYFEANSPTTEDPDQRYSILLAINNGSAVFESEPSGQFEPVPYYAGNVIQLEDPGGWEFDGSRLAFSKP